MFIVTPSRLGKRGGRVVTNARRDAMDARLYRLTSDMAADGEGVWFWHPWAGAKSADDDRQATATKKSWTPGRARSKS